MARLRPAVTVQPVPPWQPVLAGAAPGRLPYRVAFQRPRARLGPREETVGAACLWVLPNPSGLNAHYQLPDLVREFAALRRAVQVAG